KPWKATAPATSTTWKSSISARSTSSPLSKPRDSGNTRMRRREFLRYGAISAFAGASAFGQQTSGPYDTLLKGGHVIDPANNIDGPMDVAILDGKIARVAPDIPATAVKEAIDREGAVKVLDVSGFYVTPGWLDIHTHPNFANAEM